MFHRLSKVMMGMAALGALALGGSAIAGAATSSSTTPSSTTPSTSGSWVPARPAFSGPAPGTPAHEDKEKAVTGAAAAKAQAAAVKALGGGTAGPVTSDFTGTGYETTVTKSDGTKVEVHLDSAFQAFAGPGGGPHDGRGGPAAGARPGAPSGAPPAGSGSAGGYAG